MSDLNNKEAKCERCQTEEVAIICHTCQPFHNFCHRCDSIIHSMKLKTNHIREPNFNSIELNQRPSLIQPISKIPPPPTLNPRSLTPDRQYIRCFNNNDLNSIKKYNLNTYNSQRNDSISNYSNNFINEIQRLNEKEKDAMKYKIESLEKHIERLKTNFQNELKNSEDKANKYLEEKKILEDKINQIIEGTLKEKNIKNNLLTKENETLKEKIKLLEEQIKEKDCEIQKKRRRI